MSLRLTERIKGLSALAPQALNNNTVTGDHHGLSGYGYLRAWLMIGSMAGGTTTTLELLQATDAAGTDSKAITGASCTVSAGVLANLVAVDIGAAVADDTVTVNGVVFTCAAATDPAAREWADAAGLAECITSEDYGVEGAGTSVNGTVVTIAAAEPGMTLFTVVCTGVPAVTGLVAQAYIDLQAADLDVNNEYSHIAAKVTTSADTTMSVLFDLYGATYNPEQKAAAAVIL